MSMDYYIGTRIVTGENCIAANEKLLALGKSCLIVTGANSAVASGAQADVTDALDRLGIRWAVYNKIAQNPTVASCIEGGEAARKVGAEFIIGIGGGSPLDASKAVAALASNPQLDEEGLYAKRWTAKPLPIVCVGTTAGTGSEVTAVSVLTDAAGRKRSVRDDAIFATLALCDYRYTMSMSPGITCATAADALCHCVESWFNRKANDLSGAFALEGTRVLLSVFPAIAAGGADSLTPEQREQLYQGSLYGGLAINTTGTALPHAMGYFLSENHGVAHGAACAAFLPEFVNRSIKADSSRANEFFGRLGITPSDFLSLIEQIAPKVEPGLTQSELAELLPRWNHNASVEKSLFEITPDLPETVLRATFHIE